MRILPCRQTASTQAGRFPLHAAEYAARREGYEAIFHATHAFPTSSSIQAMSTKTSTLDVRADFQSGQHPREKIQTALMAIGAGETLRLLVPFEPVPLFFWAASQGFSYQS